MVIRLCFVMIFLMHNLLATCQYIYTGPGVGYAFHSSLPMFSWHIGGGYHLEDDSPWMIRLSVQVGKAVGNRNVDINSNEGYWYYSPGYTDPFGSQSPNNAKDKPYAYLLTKTSNSSQFSGSCIILLRWYNNNSITLHSGIGIYAARVNKHFIVETHEGTAHNPLFFPPVELVYLEPYYFNFTSINVMFETVLEYKLTERFSLYSTLFYQHMNRFRGLAGMHAGVQVKL